MYTLNVNAEVQQIYPVADPGFGQGGAQLVRGAQL